MEYTIALCSSNLARGFRIGAETPRVPAWPTDWPTDAIKDFNEHRVLFVAVRRDRGLLFRDEWRAERYDPVAGIEPGHWYTYRVKARNAACPDREAHRSPIIARFLTAPGDRNRDVDGFDFLTFANCYIGSDRISPLPSPLCELCGVAWAPP